MKRISGLLISAVTAAFLVGCGGGGGSSSSGVSNPSVETTEAGVTNITVDRGAVTKAIVTDANNNKAVEIGDTNVYQFIGTFSYPITATGGYVDTDNDGLADEKLPDTFQLKSNSEVITPITNYLAAFSGDELTAKIDKLAAITGLTKEEMQTKVSKTIGETKLKDFDGLKNTLFKTSNDSDGTNDDITTTVFENTFKDIKDNKKEKDIFNELRADTGVTLTFNTVSETEAKKIKEELGTATDKLKIADLGRFVSYYGEDWFDDNTLSGSTITLKPYNYKQDSSTNKYDWVLDTEANESITITKDATNPYKFTYVDPTTKEEGIFTIVSTTKLNNYSDLSKSTVKIEVTKEATESLDSWVSSWPNPYYYENSTMKSITDIDSLVASYTWNKDYSYDYYFSDVSLSLNSDGTISIVNWVSTSSSPHETKVRTAVKGSWAKESDKLVVKYNNQTRYVKVIKKDDDKYYLETTEVSNVGHIENDIIYTGSSLDDLIANIKAPAPVFTSDYFGSAAENQTTTTYKAAATPGTSNLSVTYFLSTDSTSNKFNIDSSTGVLTFKTAPDYEAMPIYNKQYNVGVYAIDSLGRTDYQNVSISVTNVDEPTSSTSTDTSTLTWIKWPSNTYNKVANFADLVAQFTAGTWYTGSEQYDSVKIKDDGKAYEGSTTNVIGTWASENEQINITLNNGEQLHLRVITEAGNTIIENTEY